MRRNSTTASWAATVAATVVRIALAPLDSRHEPFGELIFRPPGISARDICVVADEQA
ncbi:hypothetical protein [Jiangella ureilytica]|uniref:hypothetical protein n=1 Tax=Jiangella ureilytica TaxID=2530374 RepID=UPI0013A5D91A|nr:hypothetical protein [Jiangella ureilytica]